jgi:hypothetical protein
MARLHLRPRAERFVRALAVALLVSAPTLFTAQAREADQGGGDAENLDLVETVELADPWGVTASRLAESLSISHDLALEYLERRERVGELYSALRSSGPAAFDEMYIKYKPEYALVALTTTGDLDPILAFARDSGFSDLLHLVQAREIQYRTRELVDAIDAMHAAVPDIEFSAQADIVAQEVSFWPETNEEASGLQAAVNAGLLPVPPSIITVEAVGPSVPTANSFGGLNLDRQGDPGIECNSGFSVEQTDGTGNDGIATAGHCANNLEFTSGDDINYQDGCNPLTNVCGDLDAQWHTTPGYDDRAWVRDEGTTHRVVNDRTSRDNQMINDYVCLSKRNDSVQCGHIQLKTFDPYGAGTDATFVRVDAPGSTTLAVGGDSGGPWWFGNADAYGIQSCFVNADPDDACYMAQNFLAQIGVRVKINP